MPSLVRNCTIVGCNLLHEPDSWLGFGFGNHFHSAQSHVTTARAPSPANHPSHVPHTSAIGGGGGALTHHESRVVMSLVLLLVLLLELALRVDRMADVDSLLADAGRVAGWLDLHVERLGGARGVQCALHADGVRVQAVKSRLGSVTATVDVLVAQLHLVRVVRAHREVLVARSAFEAVPVEEDFVDGAHPLRVIHSLPAPVARLLRLRRHE